MKTTNLIKKKLLLILIISFSLNLFSQDLESIFENVDDIYVIGYSGKIEITDEENVIPIISTTCTLNKEFVAIKNEFENGKILGIGDYYYFIDSYIQEADNLSFFLNSINWLNENQNEKRITIKNGSLNSASSSILQQELENNGYSIENTSANLTSTILNNTDILILANNHNNSEPFSESQINLIKTFVQNGGSLFLLGAQWSWNNDFEYPMNQISSEFGFLFSEDHINQESYSVFYPKTTILNCPSEFIDTNLSRGENLKIVRMAVSCTGEFTTENGGVEQVKILLKEWIDEINLIYGREYCMYFELVQHNELLIFENPETDPWNDMPENSGGCDNVGIIMADQVEVIDNIIGVENYDVSHVILANSQHGGGCAGSYKAGISGGLDIPVTRHEIGHQFSQPHTIANGGMNNYETENGNWTIQGGNGQGRAHATSYHSLVLNLNNNPELGINYPTGNKVPEVNAGPDVAIPKETPFTLTAYATDVDSENLTYVWDNMDRGIQQNFPVEDDSQGTLFMRLLPTENPSRTFPKMTTVLQNTIIGQYAQLPTTPRFMNIRVTVNDNFKLKFNDTIINASGINSDDIQIEVTNSNPFIVTSQSENYTIYPSNSEQLITWEVGETDIEPINTKFVKISLSTDGGITFPHILSEITENDGSEIITLPNLNTEKARIKVEAIDNIFFNVNKKEFTIDSSLAIEDYNSKQLEIYPNPTSDYLTISNKNISNIQLYSSLGKLVHQQKNNFEKIDISKLNVGIYILKVKIGNEFYIKKIFKK
ncbi:zinc-dependent metalloprotease [Aureivirga marina]|uniref:zinc-dependent metalloprotease n=1 Tax=Aureivirga marina TaxID=1182451 RepID=UPI0018C90902|nr:T9SS type A sorting domain-containing protein [Aureivirga marina]